MKRPATLTRRAHPTLAVAAVLSLALLGACSTQSPTQTQVPYQSADGVAATIGDVQARDLLVVSAQKNAPGVISGSVINTSPEAVTVSFLTRDESEAGTSKGVPVQLKPGEQKLLQGVQLAKIPASPGDMTFVVMETGAGQTMVNVPVLPPVAYYATLTPTGAPTSAATTGTTAPASATTTATAPSSTTATG